MRFLRPVMLGLAMIAAAAYQPLSAKTKLVPKAYMFGFVASFNDSTVYFTPIQEIDSVWVEEKKDFLAGRSNYSYQLRNYFEHERDLKHRTCVVISSLKRKDVEKKYAKMKKQYTEKNAGKYDVRYLSDSDFHFTTVNMSDANVTTPKQEPKPKSKKDAKQKPPKKKDRPRKP